MKVDPEVADAILTARTLRLADARAACENHAGAPLPDPVWANLSEVWEWHFALPTPELQEAAWGGRN